MAIEFDALSATGYQTSVSSYSWSHTCAGNDRILIVGVSWFDPDSLTGVTYNGVSMTLGSTTNFGNVRVALYYLVNPATGSNTVVASFGAAISFGAAGAASFTGVDQSSPIDATNSGSGTDSYSAVSLTTIADNAFLVSAVMLRDASTSPDETAYYNIATGPGTFGGQYFGPQTPAGAKSLGWSSVSSGVDWAEVILSLVPASGESESSVVMVNFF